MKVIWKYPLVVTDAQVLTVPAGAQPLCVGVQNGNPAIWLLIDEEVRSQRPLTVRTYGTGHPVDDAGKAYVGTYMLSGGALVFHVFTSWN